VAIPVFLGSVSSGPACASSRSHFFDFSKDRFAFANETVWDYEAGRRVARTKAQGESRRKYSRRCFVLCRAAVQFWKFARFDPKGSIPSDAELARKIRQVTTREPLPMEERIVFPGAESLWELSSKRPEVFKKNVGLGWPIYFRPGNFVVLFPPTREGQAKMAQRLDEASSRGEPAIVWLINFPSLSINHAVVVFAKCAARNSSRLHFLVYDPNYTDRPRRLTYDPSTKWFYYEMTFYFPGGKVNVRPLYTTPWQ
jgi:hypothetical protein